MLRRQIPWRRFNRSSLRLHSTASPAPRQQDGHEQPAISIAQDPFSPLTSKLQARLNAQPAAQHGLLQPSERPEKPPKPRSIPPSSLALYWDTLPPSPNQLSYAHTFFHSQTPTLLFSASRFLNIPFTSVPEIAFLGRSNVGKSSLLNALFASSICKTSKKRGSTKTMNAFSLGSTAAGKYGLLNVLDMPGYGNGSNDAWGNEIMRYLKGRKELKRVFVLVDAVHWLKASDRYLLYQLAEARVPHQVVVSKIDRLMFPKKVQAPLSHERLALRLESMENKLELLKEVLTARKPGAEGLLPAFGQVIGCAAQGGKFRYLGEGRLGSFGVDALRWAVLQATGLAPGRETFEGKKGKAAYEGDGEKVEENRYRKGVEVGPEANEKRAR